MRFVRVDWTGFRMTEWKPSRIAGLDGLTWTVAGVLDYWVDPERQAGGRRREAAGGGFNTEAERWLLAVDGPLPGHPDQRGRQQVILTSYGGGGYYLGAAAHA